MVAAWREGEDAGGHVHHVQGDDDRAAEIKDLVDEVEVALEVGRVVVDLHPPAPGLGAASYRPADLAHGGGFALHHPHPVVQHPVEGGGLEEAVQSYSEFIEHPQTSAMDTIAWLTAAGSPVAWPVPNIPGMARFLVEAIQWRDYPIVQNLVMFIALVTVLVRSSVPLAEE